jgi:hypothetical protein
VKAAALPLVLTCAALAGTQLSISQPNHQASKSQATNSTSKQLSPEEQAWCQVLKSALVGAADQEPRMRSYLLDAVASGLSKCAPEKVRNAFVDSFTATLAIPETREELDQRMHRFYRGERSDQATEELRFNLQMKEALQRSALGHLLTIDEATVDSLLPQAEPDVRAGLMRQMISRSTSAKNFDRAIELLSRTPSKEWFPRMFPFREATQLMLELPPDREQSKQEIFRVAMTADRERLSFTTSGDDFAGMIVRFWRHIPPAIVLEAIHQVLDKPNLVKDGLTVNSSSGKMAFSNEHDYHVFELLPILRELDSDAANKLLQSSQQAQLQLKQFPNGVQSLDPSLGDSAPKQGELPHRVWLSTAELDRRVPNHTDQVNPANARVREIVRTAPDNPAQATAAAATLPEAVGFSDVPVLFPRAEAYLGIARALMKSDPSVARDALEQMSDSLKHIANAYRPMHQWTDGIMVAKEMGDADLAVGLFRSGLEEAERLRNEDSDPADPNMAIKAFWPSVCAYSGLALAASQISPQTALDGIRDLKDPEILLLLEIKLANKMLGAREVPSSTIVQKQSSHGGFYGGCTN